MSMTKDLITVDNNLNWCLLDNDTLDSIYKLTNNFKKKKLSGNDDVSKFSGIYFQNNLTAFIERLVKKRENELIKLEKGKPLGKDAKAQLDAIRFNNRPIRLGCETDTRNSGRSRGVSKSDGIDQLGLFGGDYKLINGQGAWSGGIIEIKRTKEVIKKSSINGQLDTYEWLSRELRFNARITYITTSDTKIDTNAFLKLHPVTLQQLFILYTFHKNQYFFRFHFERYSNQNGGKDIMGIDNNSLLNFQYIFEDIDSSSISGKPFYTNVCKKLIEDYTDTTKSNTTDSRQYTGDSPRPVSKQQLTNIAPNALKELQGKDLDEWPNIIYDETLEEYDLLLKNFTIAIFNGGLSLADDIIDDLTKKLERANSFNAFGFILDLLFAIIPQKLAVKFFILFTVKALQKAKLIKNIDKVNEAIKLIETNSLINVSDLINATTADRNTSSKEIQDKAKEYEKVRQANSNDTLPGIMTSNATMLVNSFEKIFQTQKKELLDETQALDTNIHNNSKDDRLLAHMLIRIIALREFNEVLSNKKSTEYKYLVDDFKKILYCIWIGFNEQGRADYSFVYSNVHTLEKITIDKLKRLRFNFPIGSLSDKIKIVAHDSINVFYQKKASRTLWLHSHTYEFYRNYKGKNVFESGLEKADLIKELLKYEFPFYVMEYRHYKFAYFKEKYGGKKSDDIIDAIWQDREKFLNSRMLKHYEENFKKNFDEKNFYLSLKIFIYCLHIKRS